MMALSFPAHRLCSVANASGLILAATGTHIQSLSLDERRVLHTWPGDEDETASDNDDIEETRPSKRIKLGHGSSKASHGREASEASEASIEFKTGCQPRQKGERRKPKIPDLSLPHVSHIIATSDGKHAVAITTEDKAVRVFRISNCGRLRQLSSRSMPKKSCAVTLSQEGQIILIADKFGDVYALPLHPTEDYQPKTKDAETDPDFKPSASELTVHTKGNLEALRQQLTQKQKQARKEAPGFEHKLLLGHVSLLTDLITATGEIDGKPRPFILTSDRDEHIRVSRGLPQTHIIHNFCPGHTEFVSKLCIVPWNQSVLIAGNGEPSLRVYTWQDGQERSRYDVLEHLRADIEGSISPERSVDELAVSRIWTIDSNEPKDQQHEHRAVLIALEALPLLFVLQLVKFELRHLQTVSVDGNILDLLHLPDRQLVAVSIDTAHEPGSYKTYRFDRIAPKESIRFFNVTNNQTTSDSATNQCIRLDPCADLSLPLDAVSMESISTKERGPSGDDKKKNYERTYSQLGELIYGLENLRKRRGKAAEEEEDTAVQEGEGETEGALEIGS